MATPRLNFKISIPLEFLHRLQKSFEGFANRNDKGATVFSVFDPPLTRLGVIFASIHRYRTLKKAFPYHDFTAKMAAGVVLVQEGGSLETLVAEVAPEITRSELSINLQVFYGSLVLSYRFCIHKYVTTELLRIRSKRLKVKSQLTCRFV